METQGWCQVAMNLGLLLIESDGLKQTSPERVPVGTQKLEQHQPQTI